MTIDLVAAARAMMPSRIRSHTLPDGRMSVECWCHRSVVYVDASVVQAKMTESCGREGCEEGCEDEGWE